MKADLRLKLRDFIKKYKAIIIIAVITWFILVAINYFLENQKPSDKPITGYSPYEPIIENGEQMPENIIDPINEIISQYIKYCNEKKYEKAYEMISKDCRECIYPDIKYFKNYVDYVFETEKVYSIQNYSNYNNSYIYRVRIFDDILATGMTGTDDFRYFEEKLVFTKENGNILFGVKGFIKKENQNLVYDDKNLKITVKSKMTSYDEQVYNMTIENKTNNYAIIYDKDINNNIFIKSARGIKFTYNEDLTQESIILKPQEKININLSFSIFYDEGIQCEEMDFENVLFLKQIKDAKELKEEDILLKYDVTMKLK